MPSRGLNRFIHELNCTKQRGDRFATVSPWRNGRGGMTTLLAVLAIGVAIGLLVVARVVDMIERGDEHGEQA